MFRKSRLGSKIVSDEGFSVEIGRDWLINKRAGRQMEVTVDVGGSEINVFTDTIGRWDDDLGRAVDSDTKESITNDIADALEWAGLQVTLRP